MIEDNFEIDGGKMLQCDVREMTTKQARENFMEAMNGLLGDCDQKQREARIGHQIQTFNMFHTYLKNCGLELPSAPGEEGIQSHFSDSLRHALRREFGIEISREEAKEKIASLEMFKVMFSPKRSVLLHAMLSVSITAMVYYDQRMKDKRLSGEFSLESLFEGLPEIGDDDSDVDAA